MMMVIQTVSLRFHFNILEGDCAHVAAHLSQPIEHKGSVKFWILSKTFVRKKVENKSF